MPLIRTQALPRPPRPPVVVDERSPLSVTYIDPDGLEWRWGDVDSRIEVTSLSGVGSPPASLASTALPGGGRIAKAYGAAPRSIVVGLDLADEDSQAGLYELMDQLADSLWGERLDDPAPGRLIFGRSDGTSRQIEVFCTSGPEQADEGSHDGYQWSTQYALTFTSALDPYLTDEVPTTVTFVPALGGDAGVPPLPPVLLRPRTVLGSAVRVTNAGNGKAWPVWTIVGPGAPTITLLDTGASFGLDPALEADEVVVVDTRPGRESAIDQDGEDRWPDLVRNTPRALWALPKGESQVAIAMAGADADSRITLSYERRWLRA